MVFKRIYADLVVKNGKIMTMDSECRYAEALAVKNGEIIYVGDGVGVEDYIGGETRVVDADGGSVLPGFIDTHIHLIEYGFSLDWIDLRNVSSISRLKELVYERVENSKPGEWIIGRSWDQERFSEKRYPNRYDLDEVSPDNPVVLTRICGHVAVVNSRALEEIGVTRGTSVPPGGIIERDEEGEPNGILKENALKLVYSSIPQPKKEDYIKAAKKAIEEANRHGLTMVYFVSAYPEEVEALQFLKEAGELKLRVRIYYEYLFLDYLNKLRIRRGFGDDFLRVNGVKIITDGSLGGRTAALREEYDDDPGNTGKFIVSKDRLMEIVDKANMGGLQLAIHAIGDRALENVLNVVEKVLGEYPVDDHRHRIEHAAVAPPDLLSKMIKLKMVAAVQPRFIISDFWTIDRLGVKRAPWIYPFKTMIEKGIVIGGGSDAPVDPLDPIYGIYSAVTRGCYDNIELCRYTSNEKLSVLEAIKLYTKYAAYLGFEEGKLGSIEVGKYADLVILSKDIMNVPEDKIKDIRVKMTIVDGKIVYEH